MEATGIRRTLVQIESAFAALGLPRATGYEQIEAGLITRPVRIGRRAVIPSDEINAIVDARVAGLSMEKIRELVGQLHARRTAAAGAPQ
jgi:predicted DNA-binding transcriptional regulator AlpA